MIENNILTVKISSEGGLHARPAGMIAKTASGFKANITIIARGEKKNAKSIMNIMAMSIKQNEQIQFLAEGEDAEVALTKIQQLFNSHFQIT